MLVNLSTRHLSLGLFAIALPALSACGFTPLYADTDQSINNSFAAIRINPIRDPEQASYVLESQLRDFISSTASARYDLAVTLREKRRSVAVTSQAQTQRFEYTLEAKYVLTELQTGKRYQNEKSAITSYGIVPSQYASQVGREDAILKAGVKLADKIETDLVLYFKGQIEGVELEAGEEFATPSDEESLREKQIQEILGDEF